METNKFEDNYKYEMGGNKIYKIEYEYYNKDNILSLLIKYTILDEAYNQANYIIYNIDTNTGNILTSEDLIKYKNYSNEVLRINFENNMENFYKNIYNQYNLEYKYENTISGVDLYNQSQRAIVYLQKYIDDYKVYLPLYIDKNGNLNTYAEVPVPSGSGFDTITISLE